jgi:RNA polymerase sigma factor (sigma-70 family)
MATITNYTTYDLEYYYADLRRLPHLSKEERWQLIPAATATPTRPALSQEIQAKHRLIESYLPFAKHLAITLCPPTLYQRLLPDLMGAVNLAVVEATMRCDLSSILNLDAYIAAYIRGAIKRTIIHDDLLIVPARVLEHARAEGTLEQVYAQARIASLDEQMRWFATDDLEEPPVSPIISPEPAPPRDPVQRAQVEEYLSALTSQQQTVLRLRYGLADEDERAYSVGEIACILGLSRKTVDNAVRAGLARLRALAEGRATSVETQGRPRITGSTYQQRHASDQVARQRCLEDAYRRLLAQGVSVTHRRLAQEAHASNNVVCAFLREKRGMSRKEVERARAEARQQQLEVAYEGLLARGISPTYERLAHAAHTSNSAVRAFLRSKRGASHAAA